MADTLKVLRGTFSDLVAKIDEYPEYSPAFATDTQDFYIKYSNTLVNVSSGAGVKIVSIDFKKIENGISYYEVTLSDGSKVEFPFNIKLDTTKIAPGELTRMKPDGTVEGTGIIFNSNTNRYESRYDFKFPSNSIWIGENVKIGQKTGFVFNHTKSLGKDYLMMDYEIDKATGSKKPIWRKIGALESAVQIQPDSSESIQNVQSVHFGAPSFERFVQAIALIFENNLHNFCMELVINGQVIEHYPSENAWNGIDSGYTIDTQGLSTPVKITLIPEIINLSSYDVTINMKADEAINLKGKSGVPYYELDLNRMSDEIVAMLSDLANLDTTGLAKKDLSNVSKDDLKAKNVMFTDMEDVDLTKLHEKGVAAKLADDTQVQNIQKEIDRIGNQPKPGDLPTYVFRGNGVPTIPSTKYKAYYIHSIVLKDNLGQITLPSNADEGVIFSVENNDRDNYINILPPAGETINGRTGSYQAQSDTLSFFVKSGTDWKEAFGGVFPNNMSALKSTIQVLLPNELNTIDEIASQLKDNLTFKRGIQTEFADQLHTFNDIEDDLVKRGYMKGLKISWGMSDIKTPADDSWISGDIEPNQHVVPAIQAQTKYLLFRVPTSVYPVIDGVYVGQDLVELTPVKTQAIGALDYRILATDNKVDLSTSKKTYINYDIQGTSTQKGIELDDGTDDKAGVTKINLKNMKLSNIFDDSSEVTLTAEGKIVFTDGNTKTDFEVGKIQSLDKSIRIANLNGVADLSKGISDHNEGIFAFLGNDQLLNSKFSRSKLYFGDIRVKGGSAVYADMNTKSFVIQDVDPQDDPNVSGGTTFIVALYYEPDPNIENEITQDGSIELELVDSNDNALIDINGEPMGAKIDYSTGDILGKELYIGEVQAKAYTEVHLKIKLNFPSEEIISVGSNTCICLQSTSKEESGGPALDSFMLHTGYRIFYDSKYYGVNFLNLARALVFPFPETTYTSDTHMTLGENLYLDVRNCKVSVSNYHLIIKSLGTLDLPVWSLTKYCTPLDSRYISEKTFKIKTTITDKDDAYRVALLEYKGTETIPPKPKLLGYNNMNPIFTAGWNKVDDLFISEDVVSGEHQASKDFAIPANSKGIAIMMYAEVSQDPMTLQLKDLEGDIQPWFNKVVITDTSHISEKYLLQHLYAYRSIVATPSGLSGYRYTVSNADTKLPIGVISGGNSRILNDNSWTDAGSYDPNKTQGDFKFLDDGTVTMNYSAQCFNEKNTLNQIHFWLAKNNGDGTFTEVPSSRIGTVIEANRSKPKMVKSIKFTFDVKANETYRFFSKSDKPDGFYLESFTDGVPLLRFDIEYNEVSAQAKIINDRLNSIDDEFVITEAAKQAGVYLELDYKDGKPVMGPKIR